MHIPDGYLSLQTSIPIFGAMLPVWSAAMNKIKNTFSIKQIPLLSLCAAFSFVIMMFNIPLGASSVHAVGAVFAAILMGPWAACLSVSVALIIQAFVFGDGGILAIGANCFNIAFAMPFSGYYVYKGIAGSSPLLSKRSMAGIFLGSYIGLNAAAFLTAVEFGIQPLLFKTAEGLPEFGFYPLWVSVPAIMLEHLLIAGPMEGIITVSTVAYLAKFSPPLFDQAGRQHTGGASKESLKSILVSYKNVIIGFAILILLTPLGLLAAGTAWGEWGTEEVRGMIGYIPQGLEKLSQFWSAIIPDYAIPGMEEGFLQSSIGYILSAAAGVFLILAVMFISGKLIVKKENETQE